MPPDLHSSVYFDTLFGPPRFRITLMSRPLSRNPQKLGDPRVKTSSREGRNASRRTGVVCSGLSRYLRGPCPKIHWHCLELCVGSALTGVPGSVHVLDFPRQLCLPTKFYTDSLPEISTSTSCVRGWKGLYPER